MIVEKGRLKGVFKGFKDTTTVFEFENGHQWKQAVVRFKSCHKYKPKAVISMRNNNHYIEIDGMGDPVMVKKVGSDNLLW